MSSGVEPGAQIKQKKVAVFSDLIRGAGCFFRLILHTYHVIVLTHYCPVKVDEAFFEITEIQSTIAIFKGATI